MNKLYFGDNLEILRELNNERVHLICTDPPFNSGRDYNAFIGDSLAQKKAFTDTWTWDTAAQDTRADIAIKTKGDTTESLLWMPPEIEPVSAKTRQEAQNMGSFKHNQKNYPRLQFWQIDDAYFNNPDSINTLVRLPDAWRIRPTQKSEHHFDNRQMQLLRS